MVVATVTLFGVAALITALGGIIATIMSHRSLAREAREEEEAKCRERLKAVRDESEELAEELHKIKMSRFE